MNQMIVAPEERAKLALKGNDAELLALAEKSKVVTKVENASELEEAHNFLMTLRKTRTNLRTLGKEARDDANKFSKAVIAEEDRLVALIETEEKRLAGLRDAYDERIEQERQAKAEAEQRRLEAIQRKFSELEPGLQFGDGSAKIQARIDAITAIKIDNAFGEMQDRAVLMKNDTLTILTNAYAAAINAEVQQAEIERLRKIEQEAKAKQEEAERIARADAEAKARQEREDQIRREAEEKARKEAEEKAEREKAAAEAETKRKAEAEELAKRRAEEREAKRLSALPDKEKLVNYVNDLLGVPRPSVHSESAQFTLESIIEELLESLQLVKKFGE